MAIVRRAIVAGRIEDRIAGCKRAAVLKKDAIVYVRISAAIDDCLVRVTSHGGYAVRRKKHDRAATMNIM